MLIGSAVAKALIPEISRAPHSLISCNLNVAASGIVAGAVADGRPIDPRVRIPMHPAMHSNMKPAGDSDLIPATLLASTGPFR